jgi:molecular chaperone HtpG
MAMDEKQNQSAEKFEFKAEMKQLLNLIINSLYTNPEIFLRELISNSSDALNKLRFKRLTDENVLQPEEELKIKISVDKENQTFSIEDTGIGMTRDDLVTQLGTVASSGTMQFLEQLKQNKGELDGNMIGRFGVGFYSVFMVTDEITVETRYAEEGSTAWRWQSSGADTYTIEECERETRGTKITFRLNDEHKEFAEDFRVKNIIRKYSNFVDFPLFVGDERVNTVEAIWHKKKTEIKQDELDEFYKFISNDYQKPMGHLHLDIEGNVNFKALIFIPETAPPTPFTDQQDKTLHLYSSKVFIQDDAKELLPEYLRFCKGVVDTEDLPLNVSREVTQSSPVMAKIRKVITGKLLSLLEEWAADDKEKYEKFFNNFGSMFKTGVNSDFSHKDRIVELLRFESSGTKPGELTSLNGYVSRMKSDQNEIYYTSGTHREELERNPNLEYFRKKELEVLLLTDPVDVFTVPYLNEYDGKPLKSIEKADIDLQKEEETEETVAGEEKNLLIDKFKSVLGDRVEDVIESKRLVDSAATLVVGQQGMDPQMEKMMQMLDRDFTQSKRILEINTNHPLIANLAKINKESPDDPKLADSINQLFEGALLIEGHMKSPADFVKRMTEFMVKATEK